MFNALKNKEKTLAVIGLGYVGLPIALEFARKIKVIGLDINDERITMLNNGIDPSGEIHKTAFEGADISFTSNHSDLRQATFFIVAVPTPIDIHNTPDLRPLLAASATVGMALKKGDIVVFESTVYPGCTEDECIPVIEKHSGLSFGKDFSAGYSPERINPGDKVHTLPNIIKVVSGSDQQALDTIASVYGLVVKAGIHKASSIKVAEAAKIIENTQRDLNIALMNELSLIFDRLGINTYEVLEAAGTKWNFLPFSPGLVGGHCIGVDPYYLTYKSQELGYNPRVILSGRSVNDNMGAYVGKKTVQLLINEGVNILNARVLVMGVTFKENVRDIRNSKVVDLVRELQSFGLEVDLVDPYASAEEFSREYSLQLNNSPSGTYKAIIFAVGHDSYKDLKPEYFLNLADGKLVFIDIKGIFRNKFGQDTRYWSL